MDQFGVFPIPVADITTFDSHFGHVVAHCPDGYRHRGTVALACLDGGFTALLGFLIDGDLQVIQALDGCVFCVGNVFGSGADQFSLDPGVHTGSISGTNNDGRAACRRKQRYQ